MEFALYECLISYWLTDWMNHFVGFYRLSYKLLF